MKIVCTQENLKLGLSVASKIISSSLSLPVLNTVLMKTENGQLTLSSTNLEVAIHSYVRCKIESEGSVCVPAKVLSDLVNSLSGKNLTLELQGSELIVTSDSANARIKTLSPEDFPIIPSVDNAQNFEVPVQELKNALDSVIFAASANETQPEISGVLFSFEENSLTLVATDRYRLGEKKLMLKDKTASSKLIVPHKTALELARILGSSEGNAVGLFSETQIAFKTSDTYIISRLIEGQYPDYKQIIPESFNISIKVLRQELLAGLRTVSIFSESSLGVRFIYGKNLKIVATSEQMGAGEVEVPANIEGEGGEALFNYRYVLDALGAINTEEVEIKLVSSTQAVIFSPVGITNYLYLVMPITN